MKYSDLKKINLFFYNSVNKYLLNAYYNPDSSFTLPVALTSLYCYVKTFEIYLKKRRKLKYILYKTEIKFKFDF